MRRLRAEEAQDDDRLDFGMDGNANGIAKKGKRKSIFTLEKQLHRPGQLSMDMNLNSPYLINPGYHDSQESLAKGFHDEHDPYRIVKMANSETGSIRSFNPMNKEAAIRNGPRPPPPVRHNATPRSLDSMDEKSNPFATPKAGEPTLQTPVMGEVRDSTLPVKPIIPVIDTVTPPADLKAEEAGFELPAPPPRSAARDSPRIEIAEMPGMPDEPAIGVAHGDDHNPHHAHELPEHNEPAHPAGLGLDFELPTIQSPTIELPPQALGHADSDQPRTSVYDDYADYYGHDDRESFYPDQQGGGLNVPQQANKRLSVGFRPLPPDEVMETEDPEFRANRIRSFYKEYFDDSTREPMPPMPNQQNAEYYDEYDTGYLNDAAYYDADTNAFVMPYAQPVTRRAMTPPPAGRRPPMGRGPRGPPGGRFGGPRGPGSVGGMSFSGGPGRPRAGSAYGPRPGSSASGRGRGPPKKKLPPPSALNTLPTPSKLKDDSFAIFNAADFAPPATFKDHVAGRSQSPLGERRPYSPSVPAAQQLATSFDDLAVLPSPHDLRKSSTFTALDFAPPKRFKDSDTMSDAGSIRSNRSGISHVQLNAIRSGAGRVSRLPGDNVFTAAANMEQLRPQWGMRT